MAPTTRQQIEFPNSVRNAQSSTEPQAAPRNILDLPQELQDIIFKTAYTKPPEVELVQYRRTLRRRTRSRRQPVVDEWLVCKKWFVAAATAYAESQTVPLNVAEVRIGNPRGVLMAFGTSFSGRSYLSSPLSYPRARTLELILDHYHFWEFREKKGKLVTLTDDQIMSLPVFERVSQLTCLQEIRVVSDGYVAPWDGDIAPGEARALETNAQRFEVLIKAAMKQRMLRDRSPDATSDQQDSHSSINELKASVSLYLGSEVCLNSSQSVSAVTQKFVNDQEARRSHERRVFLDARAAQHRLEQRVFLILQAVQHREQQRVYLVLLTTFTAIFIVVNFFVSPWLALALMACGMLYMLPESRRLVVVAAISPVALLLWVLSALLWP